MLHRKRTSSNRRAGFSLTEILIVIALIVLILAMALPAFNFISGGKSVDAAQNQISAFLSRARTEAVGLQEARGVMFYIDPATTRQTMVLVKQVPPPTSGTYSNDVEIWLDVIDSDHLPLPKGVGVQIANDAAITAAADRYFGYDPINSSAISVGRVILFDGFGRVCNQRYGLCMQTATASASIPTPMSKFLFAGDTTLHPNYPDNGAALDTVPVSSFGLVLYDLGIFKDKGYTDTDAGTDGLEEDWLNDNGIAIVVNRYNGTLVRGG